MSLWGGGKAENATSLTEIATSTPILTETATNLTEITTWIGSYLRCNYFQMKPVQVTDPNKSDTNGQQKIDASNKKKTLGFSHSQFFTLIYK